MLIGFATKDNLNPEAPSPNAMAIDPPEEHVVEPNGDSGTDNADVVLIKPDDATENEAPEANDAPLATNCTSLFSLTALYPLTLACRPR